MPKLNFETLVSALSGISTDRKIACEPTENQNPDSPPGSYSLSNDAEFNCWNKNAIYNRNESTKGTSISTNLNPNSASNSQLYSKNFKKSMATIIALPKFLKASGCRRNHQQGNTKMFPKWSASIGRKSDSTIFEPPSPKVSCIGRVKSKRDRNHRLRTAVVREKSSCSQRKKKSGFIESVCAIFRSRRRGKSEIPSPGECCLTKKRSQGRKVRDENTAIRTEAMCKESVYSEPPGLGSMSRFASRRRSESWRVGHLKLTLH